jgi:hypothetical protein
VINGEKLEATCGCRQASFELHPITVPYDPAFDSAVANAVDRRHLQVPENIQFYVGSTGKSFRRRAIVRDRQRTKSFAETVT